MTDANLMDAHCIHGVLWYECDECPQSPDDDQGDVILNLTVALVTLHTGKHINNREMMILLRQARDEITTFRADEKENRRLRERLKLTDELADTLALLALGWTLDFGVDLSQHPKVKDVLARYRESKQ